MISGPLLVSAVPGVIILLVTWWFKKMNRSLFIRFIPGILTVLAAIILSYIGFVNIRGFKGGAYGILSFYLICFAVVAFIMAKKRTKNTGS